ncbi:MAG: lipid droplet-associated protein [Gordonia sp. (in: high G+C Gram-positive bacteria)]|uniref:lipid droplet-associated protein n=1 Tax=Gordonia sp. (in: high G+C Gram-positive bacteria) TaxID=84139 RepID=UPI0039E2C70E
MKRPPYPARVAAGIVVTALEETRTLPTKVITLPMTAVSKVLQSGMRLQQNIAEMAIKGDEALSGFFDETHEQPEWATFDEDDVPAVATGSAVEAPAEPVETPPAGAGRFALYSQPPADLAAGGDDAEDDATDDRPKAVVDLGYDDLTLAQLRAKLRGLHTEQLVQLVNYERAHRNRTPFVTMIDNRIASLDKK